MPSGKIEAIDSNRPQLLVIQKSGGTLTINGDASKIQVVTPSGNIERELRRYHPGGVITVDAKKVVANVAGRTLCGAASRRPALRNSSNPAP